MRFKGTILFLITAAAAAAAETSSIADKLELVERAEMGGAFAAVAVKDKRPIPWAIFAASRYRDFKGAGRVADGDLGYDASATIWLAVLDEGYRQKGHLIFVEAGDVPGVDSDRWISLEEFEQQIMPAVVNEPSSFGGGEAERKVKDLVRRATALHGLHWGRLLLLPGDAETGWRPLTPQSPLWVHVRELDRAYRAADANGMRRAAESLGRALASQPDYPRRWKITLELYVQKYRVAAIWVGLYIAASLLFFAGAASGKRGLAGAGVWVALAGFVVATVAWVARWLIAGYLPLTSLYEHVSFLSWAVAGAFLIMYAHSRATYLGVILIPLALVLAAAASAFPSEITAYVAPALKSPWSPVHALLASAAEAAFAVAFAAATLRLFTSGRPGGLLPPAGEMAGLERRAVTWGYPLFAAALAAGAVWAQQAGSSWWSWEPKQICSAIAFLLATVYLYARHGRESRGVRTSVLAMLIFAAAAFALFANVVFAGSYSSGL